MRYIQLIIILLISSWNSFSQTNNFKPDKEKNNYFSWIGHYKPFRDNDFTSCKLQNYDNELILMENGQLLKNNKKWYKIDISEDYQIKEIYYFIYNNDFILFLSIGNKIGCYNKILRISIKKNKPIIKWESDISSFSIIPTFIDSNSAYIRSHDLIGKINLNKGKFTWIHTKLNTANYKILKPKFYLPHNIVYRLINKENNAIVDSIIVDDLTGLIIKDINPISINNTTKTDCNLDNYELYDNFFIVPSDDLESDTIEIKKITNNKRKEKVLLRFYSEITEEIPYITVDEPATFQCGDLNTFRTWVQSNLTLSMSIGSWEMLINHSYKIYVQFVVSKEGKVIDIEIIHSDCYEFQNDVIRTVSSSPQWTPAKNKGKIVKQVFVIPVIINMI